MKIKKESSKIVRPYYGDAAAAPSTDTAITLSVFDTITYNMHVAVVYAYNPPTASSATIEHGLAVALAEYREWAGKIGEDAEGRPAVIMNDAGARFVEASVDGPLDKSVLSQPSRALLSLHPPLHGDGVQELVQVQLTRFTCGSLVVGFTAHHYIADGNSTSGFLVAWGKATRGMSMEPLPLHGRTAFFPPREPRRVEFEHRGVEFVKRPPPTEEEDGGHDDEHGHGDEVVDPNAPVVVIHKAHFSKEFLGKLKSRASQGSPRAFSTFESLQAHLWRAMTRARELPPDTPTQIRISVNGRQRLRLPNEYFGNLVLWAFPRARAGDLLANPLAYAARVIHEGVARVDERYFRSFVDFATPPGAVEEEGLASTAVLSKDILCPNMEVDSWLRFPFYDLDFGGGGPFAFMPTYFNIEGMLFLLPSFVGDGSIDAFVPVFEKDLEAFRRICHTIE